MPKIITPLVDTKIAKAKPKESQFIAALFIFLGMGSLVTKSYYALYALVMAAKIIPVGLVYGWLAFKLFADGDIKGYCRRDKTVECAAGDEVVFIDVLIKEWNHNISGIFFEI